MWVFFDPCGRSWPVALLESRANFTRRHTGGGRHCDANHLAATPYRISAVRFSFRCEMSSRIKSQLHSANRSTNWLIANFRIKVLRADSKRCSTLTVMFAASSNDTCRGSSSAAVGMTGPVSDDIPLMVKPCALCRCFVTCANRFALSMRCAMYFLCSFFSDFHHFQFAISFRSLLSFFHSYFTFFFILSCDRFEIGTMIMAITDRTNGGHCTFGLWPDACGATRITMTPDGPSLLALLHLSNAI